jgi:hypothetical protein
MTLVERMASLVVASLTLLSACSSDSSPVGASSAGSSSSLAASCEKARTRASTCFANDPPKVTKKGDEDCQQIEACYGKVYREEVRNEVGACIAARDCTTGWGKCLDDTAKTHSSDEGAPAFLSKCSARRTECNEPQNTYLSESDCLEYALVIDRASFETCIAQPCKAIGACLSGLTGACDR